MLLELELPTPDGGSIELRNPATSEARGSMLTSSPLLDDRGVREMT